MQQSELCLSQIRNYVVIVPGKGAETFIYFNVFCKMSTFEVYWKGIHGINMVLKLLNQLLKRVESVSSQIQAAVTAA